MKEQIVKLLGIFLFAFSSLVTADSLVCKSMHEYSVDPSDDGTGELRENTKSLYAGYEFVVDRLHGSAQGLLVDTSSGIWSVVIHSTGNQGGDWYPSYSYLGRLVHLEEPNVFGEQFARSSKHLMIYPKYTGDDVALRKESRNLVTTFVLIDGRQTFSGTCRQL